MSTKLYQGAYCDCFNKGLFLGDIIKYDLKSMYPSIMIVFNLSPESTRLIERKPYTGEYRFNGRVIEIPDEKLGQLVVETAVEDSVSRKELIPLMKLRESYKKQGNKSGQLAIKIVMNSLYGYNGLRFARYGSFVVAVVCAAIGRYIIKIVLDVCREYNVLPLELDTDGLLTQGEDISDEINRRIHEFFKQYEYAHFLRVETERFDGALVYASKNYVLKDGNRLIFKGSAFKGRHHPPICRIALERFVRALFNGEKINDVWREFYDLKRFPFQNFIMEIEMGKDYDEYKGDALAKQLAAQLGMVGAFDQSIRFVKTVNGYVPLGVKKREELERMLDYNYYRERIRSVVQRVIQPLVEQRTPKLYEFMCKRCRK